MRPVCQTPLTRGGLPMCVVLLVSVLAGACAPDDPLRPQPLPLTVGVTPARDSVLAGDTVTLVADVTLPDGGRATEASVRWLRSPGIPIGEGHSVVALLPDTGTVTVTAEAALNDWAESGAAFVQVTPNARPTISSVVVSSTRAYDVDTVLLTADAMDAESLFEITWLSSVSGVIGTGDSLSWMPGVGVAGTHLLTARVTDQQGQRAEQLIQVEVLPTDRFLWKRRHAAAAGGNYNVLAMAGDGTIYAGFYGPPEVGCFACLWAITPDGELKWTFAPTPPGQIWGHSTGLTIATDGTVFVMDFSGTLYAVEPDGSVRWERSRAMDHDPHGRFALSPEEQLFVGSNAHVARVDPATGNEVWRVGPSAGGGCGLTLTSIGRVAIGLNGGLSLYDTTGAGGLVAPNVRGWYVGAGGPGGIVYCQGRNTTPLLSAVDSTGTVLWQLLGPGTFGGSGSGMEPVVAADGTVFTIHGDEAIAILNGTVLWRTTLRSTGSSQTTRLALLADGTQWASSGRVLHRLRTSDGAELDFIELTHEVSSPLVVRDDGTVLLSTVHNELIAVRGDAGLDPTAPWPTWRRDNRRTASVPR